MTQSDETAPVPSRFPLLRGSLSEDVEGGRQHREVKPSGQADRRMSSSSFLRRWLYFLNDDREMNHISHSWGERT